MASRWRDIVSRVPLHQRSPSELKSQLEAERRGCPFLLFSDASGQQRIIVLESEGFGRVVLGRGPGTDVDMEWDSDVSRVHAELQYLGGCWTVADDGLSRNGTFLNGERVRGRSRLADLDCLRFGKTTVIFRAPTTASPGTTSAGTDTTIGRISPAQRRVLVALVRPNLTLGGLATPATNRQIAAELFLTVGAVKMHLRALTLKFGIQDLPQNGKRARLVELALQSGEVSERDLV
jgi:DNA-binding CsgD family transcriptional regulator